MRYMLNLQERIYDKELGEGLSSTEYIFEKYYKSKNPEDYFISFTEIDKLGINPKSSYQTPLGIYTYPVKQFFNEYVGFARPDVLLDRDKRRKIGEFAPFAGKNPYVWVVKVNRVVGKFIDDYNNYSQKDYDNDIKFILEKYKEKINSWIRKGINNIDNYNYSLFNNLKNFDTEYKDSYDFAKAIEIGKVLNLDNLIYKVINFWGDEAIYNQLRLGKMWNITREFSGKNSIKWNKLLRDMGYIGVADRSGVGIIHENENIQAVFFSIKAFDIVDKIPNIMKPKESNEIALKEIKLMLVRFFHKAHDYLEDRIDLVDKILSVCEAINIEIDGKNIDTPEFYELMKKFFGFIKNVVDISNFNVEEFGKDLKRYIMESGYYSFANYKSTRKAWREVWK